ncbi:unnamed protein product [Nippostrongylus brasiliensis]|uniref:Methionine--tRNA ligase, mitochondrial n=1 Tax=Nippostrongylus brasiliensis TaxID=27835 RepID=A0A0N4YMP3_NIPBR|nr:unnamed protein product [Nippostrongylus brasiliensis]
MRLPRSLFHVARRRHSYITTPIFYANAGMVPFSYSSPHIGHLYTTVLADAASRWEKLKDPDGVHIFATGTDEHGIKIFRAAEKAKKEPLKFCDETSKVFQDLFKKYGIKNTDFIRTTEDRHKNCVEYVWSRLHKEDFIYKDKYSGWYSAIDECFFSESELEDTPSAKVVKGTSHPVEFVEESNWMFRLSALKEPVRHWLVQSDVVYPKHYLPHALRCLEYDGDLSISRTRTRLPWGIPVPGDDSQTVRFYQSVYVWMDALMNYLSVVGYPETLKTWPPSWQILGKDILKFHAFYWPAFLIAMDLPLPKKLFQISFKMSKSLGNVIDPFEATNTYTAEGLRYFLLKQGVPHADSNFSHEKAIHVINSDLVNNVGNLLSRSTVERLNRSQRYPKFDETLLDSDQSFMETMCPFFDEFKNVGVEIYDLYEDLLFYKAIERIMALVKAGNGFFQITEPWKLAPGKQLDSILYVTYETIRIASILLQPIVPDLADQALTR